jgi:hypothetical protein
MKNHTPKMGEKCPIRENAPVQNGAFLSNPYHKRILNLSLGVRKIGLAGALTITNIQLWNIFCKVELFCFLIIFLTSITLEREVFTMCWYVQDSAVLDFLYGVAKDPQKQQAYASDPKAVMKDAGLDSAHIALLLTHDQATILNAIAGRYPDE